MKDTCDLCGVPIKRTTVTLSDGRVLEKYDCGICGHRSAKIIGQTDMPDPERSVLTQMAVKKTEEIVAEKPIVSPTKKTPRGKKKE